MMLTLYLLAAIIPTCLSQIVCSKAPDKGIENMCNQIQKWGLYVRTIPTKLFGGRDFVSQNLTIFDCMDPQCICLFLTGSSTPCGWTKSLRKEYRQLTDDERARYHRAMWAIKANGDYLTLSNIHQNMNLSPGAHSGPSFLPWHREYIKRVEIALRKVDPLLPGLPYWDSTLDSRIPNSMDSILWGDELMGRTDANGAVVTGAFANWTVADGSRVFQRDLGEGYSLFTDDDLSRIAALPSITYFLAYTAARPSCATPATWDAPEFVHGKPHSWTGGDMYYTRTSTFDPIFFQHHSFVDLIWETWRVNTQTRDTRQVDYPPDDNSCTTSIYYSRSQMQPFYKINSDGLSNQYLDNVVDLAARPACTSSSSECQSRFLFCDLSHGDPRCASKIQVGGNCTGYVQGEDCCYQGVCVNGTCQMETPTTSTTTTTTPTTTTTTTTTTTSTTTVPTTTALPTTVATQPATLSPPQEETCFNNNFCCDYWSSISQCGINPRYMLPNCRMSCGLCTPQYDPTVACSDRAPNCPHRARRMDCNSPWMAENCRSYCGWCGFTRAQQCTIGFSGQPTRSFFADQPPPSSVPRVSLNVEPFCVNQHFCCAGWARLGYCQDPEFKGFMARNCQPSCNLCWKKRPHYLFNSSTFCVDFLYNCDIISRNGECTRNAVYMNENCRHTCGACRLMDIRTRLKECQLDRGDRFNQIFRSNLVAM